MCTPAEVFVGLAAEGYQLSYRRVPLSRERTPQAVDLNYLHQQITNYPGDKRPLYLFLSRTASGSSARFAAAFACAVQKALESCTTPSNAIGMPSSAAMAVFASPRSFGSPPRGGLLHSTSYSGSDSPGAVSGLSADAMSPLANKRTRHSTGSLVRNDSESSDLVRSAHAGEYRGVMNLCRVLPGGAEAKAAVDEAIDACEAVGNMRDDILKCKRAADGKKICIYLNLAYKLSFFFFGKQKLSIHV